MAKSESKKRPRDGDAEDASPAKQPEQQTETTGAKAPAAKKARTEPKKSLFVRSLPPNATDQTLTDFFSQHYPVKHAVVVLDPKTKTSRGYGFVTFADEDDTLEAKEKLANELLDGRRLKLDIAEPRNRDSAKIAAKTGSAVHNRAAETKKAREEALAKMKEPAKLIIRNLPWSIKKDQQLADLFKSYGKVRFADLPQDKGKLKGFGFVTLRGRKNAEKALEGLNGKVVDGRTIVVDWAVDKQTWEAQHGADADAEKDQPAKEKKAKKSKKDDDEEAEEDDDDGKPMTEEERDLANFMKNHLENLEEEDESDEDEDKDSDEEEDEDSAEDDDADEEDEISDDQDGGAAVEEKPKRVTDNSTTVFIRNLPFTTTDEQLKAHFVQFGAVRYARVVMDKATDRPAGTGFVCFFTADDHKACLKSAPRYKPAATTAKHSVLQNETIDEDGRYTMDGRVLQVTAAVNKDEAAKLTSAGLEGRDKDKRRLYLLAEGQIPSNSPLFGLLPAAEVKMREDSAKQRKKLIQTNPALHISLTRLAIRNIPKNIGSKELKALAREAVVGFAKDVKEGRRQPLSKEELARGGPEEKEAERIRKEKKKGIVKQAKIVFETKEGSKVDEKAGGGKSRGYGFIEYSSHRWALMGLRWLNGHAVKDDDGKTRRLIVEFAIENANVVQRRKQMEERSRQRAAAPAGVEGNAAYNNRAPAGAWGKGGDKKGGDRKGKSGDKKGGDRKGGERNFGDRKGKDGKGADPKAKFKSTAAPGKDGKEVDSKLALRTKIIARKRQMRKKKGEMRKGK
ncbi:RNA-binding domain-containing protein [Coniochaeta hoffmannii]|uniref:RNA-binding domain-containing protein n=1 Tax=Coniochaeta hoffmannii TaxID=91930 RepID=A0AA38VJJ1_9PEZI|nr:RNA-binding domain-containing protein [Coniochaeta hoffmannii]